MFWIFIWVRFILIFLVIRSLNPFRKSCVWALVCCNLPIANMPIFFIWKKVHWDICACLTKSDRMKPTISNSVISLSVLILVMFWLGLSRQSYCIGINTSAPVFGLAFIICTLLTIATLLTAHGEVRYRNLKTICSAVRYTRYVHRAHRTISQPLLVRMHSRTPQSSNNK